VRSTKASAAVERLKRRSGNPDYVMVRTGSGHFYLALGGAAGRLEPVSAAMEQEDFVVLVNGIAATKPKPLGKLDAAFESQLVRRDERKP
jgi:hypothetical protein